MKKSAQPTDYYRAYQLARKLAAKRAKRIKELEKLLSNAEANVNALKMQIKYPDSNGSNLTAQTILEAKKLLSEGY